MRSFVGRAFKQHKRISHYTCGLYTSQFTAFLSLLHANANNESAYNFRSWRILITPTFFCCSCWILHFFLLLSYLRDRLLLKVNWMVCKSCAQARVLFQLDVIVLFLKIFIQFTLCNVLIECLQKPIRISSTLVNFSFFVSSFLFLYVACWWEKNEETKSSMKLKILSPQVQFFVYVE